MSKPFVTGFTLAELLVALLILAEIATFTIPKILSAQRANTYNASAKEAMSAIAQGFQIYIQNNTISSSSHAKDFLHSNLNYISIDITGTIDPNPASAATSLSCGGNPDNNCYRLANGGLLRPSNCSFGGTSNLHSVQVTFDPDGRATGIKDSITFFIYPNGRITTLANVDNGTTGAGGCAGPYSPVSTADPSWFSF